MNHVLYLVDLAGQNTISDPGHLIRKGVATLAVKGEGAGAPFISGPGYAPCSFFAAGKCTQGFNCRFSHNAALANSRGDGVGGMKSHGCMRVQMAAVCPKQDAKAFVDSLNIFQGLFNPEHDRCYCEECYDGPEEIGNDGPHAYIIPRGWVRFGLALQPRVLNPAMKFFESWNASFHGVKSANVLESILDCGQLMKPGDTLLDGTKLTSTKCAGRQDGVFYTSPAIRYAGLKFYAEPQKWRSDTMRASMAVQCRQKPGSFMQQGQTMGFTKEGLAKHRPHADPATIEWMSDTNVAAVPYGLLVRVWEKGADLDAAAYASPVDGKKWWST